MTGATDSLAGWLVDCYALVAIVGLGAVLATRWQKQPARRLAVCSAAIAGWVVLVVVPAVPTWPRLRLVPGRAVQTRPPDTPAAPDDSVAGRPQRLMRPVEEEARRPAALPESAAQHIVEDPPAARLPDRPRGTGGLAAAAAAFRTVHGLRLLVAIYLAGSFAMIAWLSLGCWLTASLRRRSRPAPERLTQALARLVGPEQTAPELVVSADLMHPVAVGARRPRILLPVHLVADEQEDRVAAALAHEWAHIRNRDLWTVALLRLLLPLLYAHPAYWWVRRLLRDDQEALADAAAAGTRGAVQYAEVLLAWASQHPIDSIWRAGASLALFEHPSQLKRRIAMLLDKDLRVESTCPRWWRAVVRGGAAAAVLGLSLLSLRPTAQADAPPAAAETRDQPAPAGTGRLLGPDGQPVAGARVYLSTATKAWLNRRPTTPVPLGTTAVDGSFPFPQPAEPSEAKPVAHVIAIAEGYGPAIADATPAGAADRVLRLVRDDVPIRGRILDTKGRPVAGAEVEVVGLLWHPSGTLDPWIEALKKEESAFAVQSRLLRSWAYNDVSRLLPRVSTDRDGRFTLKGIGRERIAALLVSGPGMATSETHVATRTMPTLKYADFLRQNFNSQVEYFGAEFEMTAEPGMVVSGTVTDHDTGKPLAHVKVMTASLFGNPLETLETVTDDQGRYRLAGIPARDKFGQAQELLAGPDDDAPYLTAVKTLGKWDGASPVHRDFTLKRGVRVRGRVVNAETGKGVSAGLGYYIAEDNPYLKSYPAYGTVNASPAYRTDADGAFSLIVMPGHGAIGARASGDGFRLGLGMDPVNWPQKRGGAFALYDTVPEQLVPIDYHTVLSIDPKQGDDSTTCEIRLEPGKTVQGKVVGPDGAPLEGFRIEGLGDHFRRWTADPSPTSEFLVKALGPQSTRDIFVYHEGKRLAGAYVVRPGEAGPITVKLEPCGTVTGRLVGADGKPLSEVELVGATSLTGDEFALGTLPPPVKTDADGRFRATGLIPGKSYLFHAGRQRKWLNAAKDVTVPSGQAKDLGNLVVESGG